MDKCTQTEYYLVNLPEIKIDSLISLFESQIQEKLKIQNSAIEKEKGTDTIFFYHKVTIIIIAQKVRLLSKMKKLQRSAQKATSYLVQETNESRVSDDDLDDDDDDDLLPNAQKMFSESDFDY